MTCVTCVFFSTCFLQRVFFNVFSSRRVLETVALLLLVRRVPSLLLLAVDERTKCTSLLLRLLCEAVCGLFEASVRRACIVARLSQRGASLDRSFLRSVAAAAAVASAAGGRARIWSTITSAHLTAAVVRPHEREFSGTVAMSIAKQGVAQFLEHARRLHAATKQILARRKHRRGNRRARSSTNRAPPRGTCKCEWTWAYWARHAQPGVEDTVLARLLSATPVPLSSHVYFGSDGMVRVASNEIENVSSCHRTRTCIAVFCFSDGAGVTYGLGTRLRVGVNLSVGVLELELEGTRVELADC